VLVARQTMSPNTKRCFLSEVDLHTLHHVSVVCLWQVARHTLRKTCLLSCVFVLSFVMSWRRTCLCDADMQLRLSANTILILDFHNSDDSSA